MKKVISFCLYGDNHMYIKGAFANVVLMRRLYPKSEWELRFYVKDIPLGVAEDLRARGATVIECEYANMMMARYLPCLEPDTIAIFRDCDSYPNARELRAVNEWLESDKPRHVIRDHPAHLSSTKVMGGLWGNREQFTEKQAESLYKHLQIPCVFNADQQWLTNNVWRDEDFMVHQYNVTPWMIESYDPHNHCGMKRFPHDHIDASTQCGFFNRINGVASAMLCYGNSCRIGWGTDQHMPFKPEELFKPDHGINFVDYPAASNAVHYYPYNSNNPLNVYWLTPYCDAEPDLVADTYKRILDSLDVKYEESPPSLGIRYRGLHPRNSVNQQDFADWCYSIAMQRGVKSCYLVADTGAENIASILRARGMVVEIGGTSRDLKGDMDRNDLAEMKTFIGGAVTLAHCQLVLSSMFHETATDMARAFGKEVIYYDATLEGRGECWFDANRHKKPSRLEFKHLHKKYTQLYDEGKYESLYGTHIEALDKILTHLKDECVIGHAKILEVGGGNWSTPILLESGAQVITLEQGQNVSPEENNQWRELLHCRFKAHRNWTLVDAPGKTTWQNIGLPEHVNFAFVDGNGDCRKEIVETLIARGTPTIAAHDSENSHYRYDQIAPMGYEVFEFKKFKVYTRIWTMDVWLRGKLKADPDYAVL